MAAQQGRALLTLVHLAKMPAMNLFRRPGGGGGARGTPCLLLTFSKAGEWHPLCFSICTH